MKQQIRAETDAVKRAELEAAYHALRLGYKPLRLPADLKSAEFSTISEVGEDFVEFKGNGVQMIHRLASISTIIRGVKLDEH